MTFTIELSYPNPILSPNARAHWRKVHDARLAQKHEAYYAVLDCVLTQTSPIGICHLTLTFCPRSKRRYDLDNALASMKGALDGVAAALGVDDSRFTLTLKRGEPVKGGKVIVKVEAK